MKQAYAILLSLSLATLALAAPASAEDGTYTCEVKAGLSNPVGPPTAIMVYGDWNIGGCDLVTTSEASVVESLEPADDCSIYVESAYSDRGSPRPAEEGTEYPTNSRFVAFCESGVVDAVNSVTLATAE